MSVSFVLLFVVGVMACGVAFYRTSQTKTAAEGPVLMADSNDEDMKVVGGSFPSRKAEDPAEAVARQFLRQKKSGNIEKARTLGSAFAQMLLQFAQSPEENREKSMLEIHHRLLLCAYIVNRVIGEQAPDPLLAQTSLQVFYRDIEEESSSLYKNINDLAAFSLYMLWERSGSRDTGEIGRIYARLCNREGEIAVENEGNALYSRFHGACAEAIKSADYSQISD